MESSKTKNRSKNISFGMVVKSYHLTVQLHEQNIILWKIDIINE